MTVRFFPGSKKQKTSLIEGFLTQHHVAHELARPEDLTSKTFHLGTDPALDLAEPHDLLAETAIPPCPVPARHIADPADTLPVLRDGDGHDAKCGYGVLSATRACLSAADPICAALLEMGEEKAARGYHATSDRTVYSAAFGAWAARVVRRDRAASHGLRVLLRHLRLLAVGGGRPAA